MLTLEFLLTCVKSTVLIDNEMRDRAFRISVALRLCAPFLRDEYLAETSVHSAPRQSAVLAGLSLPRIPVWEAEDSLDELGRLAASATLEVADRIIQVRKRIDSRYYVGKGKAVEIEERARELGAGSSSSITICRRRRCAISRT